MYVCLCNGVTSQTVIEAVANGHDTTKKIAAVTGAGDTCGRCKGTIRQIIAAYRVGALDEPPRPTARAGRWLARKPE